MKEETPDKFKKVEELLMRTYGEVVKLANEEDIHPRTICLTMAEGLIFQAAKADSYDFAISFVGELKDVLEDYKLQDSQEN